MKDPIVQASDSPHELEVLYRSNRKEFTRALPAALAQCPDSAVLQAWHERLFFSDSAAPDDTPPPARWQSGDIALTVILSLVAGTLMKLPHFLSALDGGRFYARNLASIVIGALILFFCVQKSCRDKTLTTILTILAAALIYLNWLPGMPNSDTVFLACLHLPFALWSLLGIAFVGGKWRDLQGRMDYLRYNGELLIYTTLILIGGMVLTGLTLGLFGLIHLQIEEWYGKNVAVYGSVAAPIVATLLITRIVGNRFRMAPLLAKVFTPLFLTMVLAYLIAMAIQRSSPYDDRDFLVAFNCLLMAVLGICVFSISERGHRPSAGALDLMNLALVSVTLVIDLVALSAIVYRLSSYGFTPNRVAVLGANLLIFGHLAGIAHHYLRFIRNRAPFAVLENWIVRYLPAYTAWSVVAAVALPLLFKFA